MALVLGLCAVLAGCGGSGGGAADTFPKDAASIERGRQVFAGTCGAYCHKMTNIPVEAPFLFDCDWLHGGSETEIFNTINHGVPKTRMVGFAGALPDDDIRQIVAYLKSASQCGH